MDTNHAWNGYIRGACVLGLVVPESGSAAAIQLECVAERLSQIPNRVFIASWTARIVCEALLDSARARTALSPEKPIADCGRFHQFVAEGPKCSSFITTSEPFAPQFPPTPAVPQFHRNDPSNVNCGPAPTKFLLYPSAPPPLSLFGIPFRHGAHQLRA